MWLREITGNRKSVSDLQTICYTNYLDGRNSIRQEVCVLFQHYYSIPKKKMRPTAGHKLCQTLNTNLHPSVFPFKSRRALRRTMVLVLACDCQKCGRKLPARQRLWRCLSGGCRWDGQCWTQELWQWSTHMEQRVWKIFPAGRMSCFASCLPESETTMLVFYHFPALCSQESASPKAVVK